MKIFKISGRFTELITALNNFHKNHGITLLSTEKKTKLELIRNGCFAFSVFGYEFLFILASTSKFSLNNNVERTIAVICAFAVVSIFVFELLYLVRRKEILELVDWCHWVETYQPTAFAKPDDWFQPQRKKVYDFIR